MHHEMPTYFQVFCGFLSLFIIVFSILCALEILRSVANGEFGRQSNPKQSRKLKR